ncbi:MAG: MFS transporter [Bacteroidota bacterium]|jgi:UMF1 family MFS transporter
MQKNDPKVIRAWTFYDWANSVYPLCITSAIFPNFYDKVTSTLQSTITLPENSPALAKTIAVLDNQQLYTYNKTEANHQVTLEIFHHQVNLFEKSFDSSEIYSYVYSFALLIVVLIIPLLSGIADYFGNKKRYLQFFCVLGSLSCMSIYFFNPQNLAVSFIPFITATIGFWASLVFYNSYLPEIADESQQDKVSARGFAMGYFGSSILLIICLALIIGVGKEFTRYSFLLVGLWWIGFAQITFFKLPNKVGGHSGELKGSFFTKGFREIKSVFAEAIKQKSLKRFLFSYFFYNMGVQTVLVMAVLFARKEIIWEDEKIKTNSLIISILLIQFLGIAGSFMFSYLSKKIGNIKTIGLIIFLWMAVCIYTYFIVRQPIHFFVVAATVGLVMGGIQSLSRSTYSKLIPETHDHTSYFSLYDVLEKIGIIIGSVTFGLISQFAGGMRNSVLALIVFFVIGIIILFTVPKLNQK